MLKFPASRYQSSRYPPPHSKPRRPTPFYVFGFPAIVALWTIAIILLADQGNGWDQIFWRLCIAPAGNIALAMAGFIGPEVRKVFDRNYRPGRIWPIVVVAPLASQMAVLIYIFNFGKGGG
jgi:hypothetical protein